MSLDIYFFILILLFCYPAFISIYENSFKNLSTEIGITTLYCRLRSNPRTKILFRQDNIITHGFCFRQNFLSFFLFLQEVSFRGIDMVKSIFTFSIEYREVRNGRNAIPAKVRNFFLIHFSYHGSLISD